MGKDGGRKRSKRKKTKKKEEEEEHKNKEEKEEKEKDKEEQAVILNMPGLILCILACFIVSLLGRGGRRAKRRRR